MGRLNRKFVDPKTGTLVSFVPQAAHVMRALWCGFLYGFWTMIREGVGSVVFEMSGFFGGYFLRFEVGGSLFLALLLFFLTVFSTVFGPNFKPHAEVFK